MEWYSLADALSNAKTKYCIFRIDPLFFFSNIKETQYCFLSPIFGANDCKTTEKKEK